MREEIPQVLVDRYDAMLAPVASAPECTPDPGTGPRHLRWMVNELRRPMAIFKGSRWLGFVQHGIIGLGLTTVSAERDFSRPWFNAHHPVSDPAVKVEHAISIMHQIRDLAARGENEQIIALTSEYLEGDWLD